MNRQLDAPRVLSQQQWPIVIDIPQIGIPRDDWVFDALYAQTDPEAFYPPTGGSTREAKRVCMRCEVREQCSQWALDHHERYGVWGGLSERQRRRLKRDGAAGQVAAAAVARRAVASHERIDHAAADDEQRRLAG